MHKPPLFCLHSLEQVLFFCNWPHLQRIEFQPNDISHGRDSLLPTFRGNEMRDPCCPCCDEVDRDTFEKPSAISASGLPYVGGREQQACMNSTLLCHCAPEAVLFMGSERSAHHQQQHRSASWAGGHPAAHGLHTFPVPTIHDGPGKSFDAIPDACPPQGTGNLPEVRASPCPFPS